MVCTTRHLANRAASALMLRAAIQHAGRFNTRFRQVSRFGRVRPPIRNGIPGSSPRPPKSPRPPRSPRPLLPPFLYPVLKSRQGRGAIAGRDSCYFQKGVGEPPDPPLLGNPTSSPCAICTRRVRVAPLLEWKGAPPCGIWD